MATTDIRTDRAVVHNVGADLLAQIRLDGHIRQQARQLVDLGIRQVCNLARLVDRECGEDLEGSLLADTVEQREGVLLYKVRSRERGE